MTACELSNTEPCLTFTDASPGGNMRFSSLLKIMLASLLITGTALAQGVGASGDIVGTVTDQSGAVISGGSVTATDLGKGTKRTVTTAGDGQYEFIGLP